MYSSSLTTSTPKSAIACSPNSISQTQRQVDGNKLNYSGLKVGSVSPSPHPNALDPNDIEHVNPESTASRIVSNVKYAVQTYPGEILLGAVMLSLLLLVCISLSVDTGNSSGAKDVGINPELDGSEDGEFPNASSGSGSMSTALEDWRERMLSSSRCMALHAGIAPSILDCLEKVPNVEGLCEEFPEGMSDKDVKDQAEFCDRYDEFQSSNEGAENADSNSSSGSKGTSGSGGASTTSGNDTSEQSTDDEIPFDPDRIDGYECVTERYSAELNCIHDALLENNDDISESEIRECVRETLSGTNCALDEDDDGSLT